jgi:2-polyprenyl-3-methyl-5-hydroxy-6-metoxy-1,4-benzoquinol methylase
MLEAAPLIDTRSVGFAVDVGGARGSLIHALMKENPSLHGAVLDLPHVSADATRAAEALGLQDRLTVIGGDFLVEVPSADLYLMKHILHDWADEACISILRNCRRAIKPNGRVVLIEIAMDEINPPPHTTQIDLTMMVVLGAKERTLEQYKALLTAAGFRFTRITTTATPFSLIEAVAA